MSNNYRIGLIERARALTDGQALTTRIQEAESHDDPWDRLDALRPILDELVVLTWDLAGAPMFDE